MFLSCNKHQISILKIPRMSFSTSANRDWLGNKENIARWMELWWCNVFSLQEYPRNGIFVELVFKFSDKGLSILDGVLLRRENDGDLPFDIPRFRLCMTEWPFCFFSIPFVTLHYRRSLISEQMGGRTSSHLHPKDLGVLFTFEWHDCVQWLHGLG